MGREFPREVKKESERGQTFVNHISEGDKDLSDKGELAMWGELDREDPAPLLEVSGLSVPEDHGPLVVVPVAFLEGVSGSNAGVTLQKGLFGQDRSLEDLLQISEGEKVNLQRAWRKARRKIENSESSRLNFEDVEEGSVRITVPDMAEQFRLIGDEFQTLTGEVLGVNRARAFLASKRIGAVFNPEAGERVYTVNVEAVGDGRWRYRMSSSEPGGANKVWVGESIPQAYRHLTDKAQINPNLNPPEEEGSEE